MAVLPVPPQPLDYRGRFAAGLLIAECVLLWLIGLASVMRLPSIVPVHFGFSGTPDRYGSRYEFLLLLPALSIAPVLILLVVVFRFTLINRFPYLLNLPAFFLALPSLTPERRAAWLNRYMTALLVLGDVLTAWLILLEVVLVASAASGRFPFSGWSFGFVISSPLVLAGCFLIWMSRLNRTLLEEVRHH